MRLLFSLLFIGLFVCSAKSQIIWDGEGDGISWSDADNWVGNVLPGASDDVLLDNSIVSGTYTVTLPNSSVTINGITIEPSVGSSQIFLVLPSTNMVSDDAFVTTGNGITIGNRGIFENNATVLSGINITLSTTADSMVVKNGGTYRHLTPSSVSGWVQKLSKSSGTENGIFTFAVPAVGYNVDLGGVTFGALNFSPFDNSFPIISYMVNGTNDLNIRSDLNVVTGATVSLGMSANINVNGNFWVNFLAVFDFQNSINNNTVKIAGALYSFGTLTKTGFGIPRIQLNGVSAQDIYVGGDFSNSIEFEVDNPTWLALKTTVTLPYKLILTNGKIRTYPPLYNLLILADDATSSGGSVSSFVQGPMKKIGNEDFIFPIGWGGIYAPLSITNVSGELPTDEFTAEYKRANPQSTSPYGSGVGSDLNHVSYVEYWTLTQGLSTTSSKKVSLDVHATSFCKVLQNTYVCRWNGTIWNREATNFSNFTEISPYQTGTITTVNGMSGFTAPSGNVFTLGTDLNFIMNPLPVNLISFGARKMNDSKSLLEWELAECCAAAVKFEVERAGDNRVFKTIETIGGSETNRFYSVTDDDLKAGVNYYRLKITDENGFVMYSKTVTIMNGSKALLMALAPTATTDRVTLTFSSSNNQRLDIYITDMQGKVVRNIHQQVPAGNSNLFVVVSDFNAGMYQVIGVIGNERTNVTRFIKQ